MQSKSKCAIRTTVFPIDKSIACVELQSGYIPLRLRKFEALVNNTANTSGISELIEKVAPLLFVVLWSTGFIGAKYGLPYAEPFTFLAIRMAITLAILYPVVLFFVDEKPDLSAIGHSMVAGMLIHSCYLGAVFFAISRGMSAGIAALVVALQPLITTFVARVMIGETVQARQIAALFAALGGVILVLSPRFTGESGGEGITIVNVGIVVFSVVAISIGSVYQKKFSPVTDLRANTAYQYLGALIPLTILSFAFETREVDWSGHFIFAMAWLIFVLSIGAVGLLMFLIRRNSAAQTASLFYLVPVSTAIIAYFMFDEKLTPVQLLGMLVVVVAVASVGRRAKK